MERQGAHLYSLKSALRPTISTPSASTPGQSHLPADHANHHGRQIRPILVTSASAGSHPVSSGGNSGAAGLVESSSSSTPSLASLFKPVSARRYNCNHWALVSLKRSSTGLQSVPSTPTTQTPPQSPQAANLSRPFLIATLLHLPTQILYAWPIALKGTSSGRCFVTHPVSPPLSAATYNADAVMSESIKVLSDVIQAWIKTGPMRESLRRKESRREKGMRKIGENQQDAIWLNDGLGLAQLNELDRALALERTWKCEGESVQPGAPSHPRIGTSPSSDVPASPTGPTSWPSPFSLVARSPSSSPSLSRQTSFALPPPQPSFATSAHAKGKDSISSGYNSGGEGSVTTPSSVGSPIRPATPRIEIYAPDDAALTLGGALLALKQKHTLSSDHSQLPKGEGSGRSTVTGFERPADEEMREWMIATTLSDPPRSRDSTPVPSVTGHYGSTNRARSGSGPPILPSPFTQRKSVTFSEGSDGDNINLPPHSDPSTVPNVYRPPFAPGAQLSAGEDDEPEELIIGGSSRSSWASSGDAHTTKPSPIRTSFLVESPVLPSSSSSPLTSSPSSQSTRNLGFSARGNSSSIHSTGYHQRGHSEEHRRTIHPDCSSQDAESSTPSGRGSSCGRIMLTPASSSTSILNPPFARHSRGGSKLSYEIPRNELSSSLQGGDDGGSSIISSSKKSGSGGGKLSPVQSFADLKTALKSGFRNSKKKPSALTG